MKSGVVALFSCLLSALADSQAAAQVQIRIGDPARATYSELHEALRDDTPAGDSVAAILRVRKPAFLWRRLHAAVNGTGDWNSGLIALTHLAELRSRAFADTCRGARAARSGARVVASALRGDGLLVRFTTG